MLRVQAYFVDSLFCKDFVSYAWEHQSDLASINLNKQSTKNDQQNPSRTGGGEFSCFCLYCENAGTAVNGSKTKPFNAILIAGVPGYRLTADTDNRLTADTDN